LTVVRFLPSVRLMTTTHEAILNWTVRLSLLAMWAAWMLRLRAFPEGPGSIFRWARRLWSAGAGLMILHICAAFAYVHAWSHAAAAEATAAETLAVTGSSFGGGVWFNYVFLVLWVADAIWWWLAERGYLARSKWIDALVYGFMIFIAFQATVVFEAGVVRWGGVVATVALACVALLRVRQSRKRT